MGRGMQAALLLVAIVGADAQATSSVAAVAPGNTLTPTMSADWQNVISGFLKGIATPVIGSYATQLQSLFGSVAGGMGSYNPSQYEAVLAQYEAEDCTPASYTPSYYVPANYTGPAMTLTFTTGSCAFNETGYVQGTDPVLQCVQPAIIYSQAPAVFTSKYISPSVFTSKVCNLNITVPGMPTYTPKTGSTEVLYVFSGQQVDPNGLTNAVKTLQSKVSDLFSGSGYSG